MRSTLWFCLVAVMIAVYVVLDGFDIGAGIIHLFVARKDARARAVLRAIGPVWDGNEVWLLAGGGTLYFAFPALYASSFSGFYLPLMIVLWLLILRGISIEFRNHIDTRCGRRCGMWFSAVASAAAGDLLRRGAGQRGARRAARCRRLFLPAAVDRLPRRFEPAVLDWYTILAGVAALAVLAMHGSLWVALKTTGAVRERSRRAARKTVVGSRGLGGHPHGSQFCRAAFVAAELRGRSVGFSLPGARRRGTRRNTPQQRRGRRTARVPVLVRSHRRITHQRRFRSLSERIDGVDRPAVQPHHPQRGGGRLRSAHWIDMVDRGHGTRFRLHVPRLPALRGKDSGRNRRSLVTHRRRSRAWSVLVIGGGPAGLAAAIAARRKGFRVRVMDAGRPPIDKACGEGLMPDALRALNQSGVAFPRDARPCFPGDSLPRR